MRKHKAALPSVSNSSSLLNNSLDIITLPSGWQINTFTSLTEGKTYWEQLSGSDDFFLSGDFFSLIDDIDLKGVATGFAIFEHPNHDSFGLVLQTFSFNPEEQMGKLDQNDQYGRFQRLAKQAKDILAKILRFRILSIGQLLLTGNHGLRGNYKLSTNELAALISEGCEAIARIWPERIHGIMIKDLPLDQHPRAHAYHPLPVQPNMVLHLDPSWSKFTDYLDAMSSKYRVRARRARKKGDELIRRELSLDETKERQAEMHRMYCIIAEQSDFNAVVLPAHYFTNWQEQFPGKFKIWGYFLEEEFIGFSTAVYNGKELEAHFLGFEADYNRSHQLYLNMLYDLVQEAIIAGSKELIFSRTALEIKSSVGAVAEDLYCWMRARYTLVNPLVPIVAKFIAPLPEWEPRHPFKD
ncbi:GNAT family N-acetyltransferase [Lewinella cohaerens]|uniref:GNAT family N-acetyltransferase n=1 Tax=Lewinella cohaerens TaxID=70995 RepID=UPI00036C4830|nr:GNAT family N-acetyltransferase [Lewinella cohaerens]